MNANGASTGNNDMTYENQNILFSNQNLGDTVATISQSSVRSAHMNATSGATGFNNFGISLAGQSQARNSVVGGGRHIPITKFSRGQTRGRGAALGGESNTTGNKRVTSINFYQNQAGKLKNAMDISMNKFDGGQNVSHLNSSGKQS